MRRKKTEFYHNVFSVRQTGFPRSKKNEERLQDCLPVLLIKPADETDRTVHKSPAGTSLRLPVGYKFTDKYF